MKYLGLLLIFNFSFNGLLLAQELDMPVQEDTALQKDIRELLVLTGSAEMGIQVMGQMISYFKESYQAAPDEFWNQFMDQFQADDLINLILPIYEKHYTHQDIKDLIAFYKTPIGKKSIEVLPNITQESMTAGQQWGAELGEKIVNELKKEGYTNE